MKIMLNDPVLHLKHQKKAGKIYVPISASAFLFFVTNLNDTSVEQIVLLPHRTKVLSLILLY